MTHRTLMAPLALLLLLLLLGGSVAAAGPLYDSPNGFWLLQRHQGLSLVGPTRPDANWHIAAWGIPESLPAFDAAGVSQNAWARVNWLGNASFSLSQDSSTRRCAKVFPSGSRLVNEFDLLAEPNNGNVPAYPQAVLNKSEPLATLSRIEADVTLDVTRAEIVDRVCRVSATFFIYAVVLTNPSTHQVVFYQLRLAHFAAGSGSGTAEGSATPGWFFTGKNIQSGQGGHWGYGDNITAFGQPWAKIGVPHTYEIDLLPRLKELIAEGARTGLDQDLSDWRLTGAYHGQVALGHVRNDATWSGFALKTE